MQSRVSERRKKRQGSSSESNSFLPLPPTIVSSVALHGNAGFAVRPWKLDFSHPTSNLNWRCSSWLTVSAWELVELRHKMNKSCLPLAGHRACYFNHQQVHGHITRPWFTLLSSHYYSTRSRQCSGFQTPYRGAIPDVLRLDVEKSFCHLRLKLSTCVI